MPTFTSFRFRHLYMGLALAGAFITGWVTAGTQIATEINTGLVRALNSVGQDPVWQRGFQCILPPNPIYPEPGPPNGPVQLFIGTNTAIPAAVSVFYPPNPVDQAPIIGKR